MDVLVTSLIFAAVAFALTALVWWRSRGQKTWWSSHLSVFRFLLILWGIGFAIVAPLVLISALLELIDRSDLTAQALVGFYVTFAIVLVGCWLVVRRRRRRRLEIEQERERSLPFAKLRDY